MTLRDIDIFCTVFEELNITRAAQRLYISQPTVSNVLRTLEAVYGCKLFEKMHGRLEPTRQGIYFYSIGKKIQSLTKELDVNSVRTCDGRPVHVGFYSSFSEGPLEKLMSYLQSLGFEIRPTIANYHALLRLLEIGTLDFALSDYYIEDRSIVGIPIFRDKLILFCAENHICPDSLCLSELSSYPLITREQGSGDYQVIHNFFAEHRLSFHPWMETTSNYALFEAVRNGRGIAFSSVSYYEHVVPKGNLRRIQLSDGWPLKVRYILLPKKNIEDPITSSMINRMVDFLQSQESQTPLSEVLPWRSL